MRKFEVDGGFIAMKNIIMEPIGCVKNCIENKRKNIKIQRKASV